MKYSLFYIKKKKKFFPYSKGGYKARRVTYEIENNSFFKCLNGNFNIIFGFIKTNENKLYDLLCKLQAIEYRNHNFDTK